MTWYRGWKCRKCGNKVASYCVFFDPEDAPRPKDDFCRGCGEYADFDEVAYCLERRKKTEEYRPWYFPWWKDTRTVFVSEPVFKPLERKSNDDRRTDQPVAQRD